MYQCHKQQHVHVIDFFVDFVALCSVVLQSQTLAHTIMSVTTQQCVVRCERVISDCECCQLSIDSSCQSMPVSGHCLTAHSVHCRVIVTLTVVHVHCHTNDFASIYSVTDSR